MEHSIEMKIDVAWGDMDAFGHVNNCVYFKYFESIRIAHLGAMGKANPEKVKIHPLVVSTKCDYKSAVVFPDTLIAGCRVSKLGNSSFTHQYSLYSEKQQKIVAEGEATIVAFDPEAGKSMPIPDSVRAAMEKVEGRSL